MQRYFTKFNEEDQIVELLDEDVHHIKNVMRMREGDEIIVSNQVSAFYAKIVEISEMLVRCELLYKLKNNSELPISISIAQGLPKGDKFEYVIQKTTELGVNKLIPVISERTIVKLDHKKEKKKLMRWKKIVKEAAEQSHRVSLPEINSVISLRQLIRESFEYDYKLVAYEATNEEDQRNFKKVLNKIQPGERILIFIGPEGGITPSEIKQLTDAGFLVTSLGPRILRTETAPLYVMSCISYELELEG
ncbi:16S rRNA (uracil(1498)-N(3))-methyltransferase [Haloplasma contractile]|uniref:Ribosomal RNA small subunit methyltransferase E n=1 Tax=Haloplasma contractile SSD-17B TaxID=1033810 RepID=U2FRT4_9MOLU|nr:16S rRNA (uracil(1498)-N(3))-methyltransferase [Haloplasma contractile]ERJ13674.1 Ribosomal RNA small subunit methyltransferase E protein [Haloplasma contractile SSD-17B]